VQGSLAAVKNPVPKGLIRVPPAENVSDKRKRVLSGMRPTGRLHIGHYFGALQNWISLQNDPQYECFYFIADWHALTTDYADTSFVAQNTIEIGIDWLAAGLDPDKSTLFVQQWVPEHAELNLLLSMIAPLGWLERVPTYKEALDNIKDKDLHTLGFLGYPVLQTADIVMYGEPDTELVVPVGEDQKSHVELGREIVRKFNFHFGLTVDKEAMTRPENAGAVDTLCGQLLSGYAKGGSIVYPFSMAQAEIIEERIRERAEEAGLRNLIDYFAKFVRDETVVRKFVQIEEKLREPEAMLTHTPRIPGLDGRKMSKSYGNAIMLSESDEDIRKKTKVMVTDPARKRRQDPGNPEVCPVFDWHKLFSPKEVQDWSAHGCRTAGIGCIECKAKMADHLIQWIEPIRQRRRDFESDPQQVLEYLDTGSKRARMVAQQTMDRVREAVFHWDEKREEIGGRQRQAKNIPAGRGD
jgi:tryptophanyl-tRNA synthetase